MTEIHINESTIVDELSAGRAVTYFTIGVSMRPLLRTNETHVHICPAPWVDGQTEPDRIRDHDIVLYVRPNGQLVLHRLLWREGDICCIRGDNTYSLERVRREQIIGVVDLIWRKGSYIDVASDRRYARYVARRIRNYPFRAATRRVYFKLRSVAKRILRPGKHA